MATSILKDKYLLETKLKKFAKAHNYQSFAKNHYSFLSHVSQHFKLDYSQLLKAFKSGKISVYFLYRKDDN